MLWEYDKVEEPCVRIHARMTTCVPDCRIKDSSRDGIRTKGTAQRYKEARKGRNEERGSPRGWLWVEVSRSNMPRTCISPCRNFRGLSCWLLVCFSLFDSFAKLFPFFSQYSILLRHRILTEIEILHLFFFVENINKKIQ